MKSIGQLFLGLLTAIASSLFVLAAASYALIEGGGLVTPQPTQTPVENIADFETAIFSEITPTPVPLTPTPSCYYPEGWIAYQIMQGDTLEKLAAQTGTTAQILFDKNCLLSDSLVVGSLLYRPESVAPTLTDVATTLPPEPAKTEPEPDIETSTPTQVLCGPPSGWVPYYVKRGDTLFRIGLAYGITVDYLKFANCLTSDAIQVGQRLFVPNVAPRLPSSTPTPTDAPPPQPPTKTPKPTNPPTPIPTAAPTDIPPTDIPTDIPTEIPTSAPTEEPYPPPYYPSQRRTQGATAYLMEKKPFSSSELTDIFQF